MGVSGHARPRLVALRESRGWRVCVRVRRGVRGRDDRPGPERSRARRAQRPRAGVVRVLFDQGTPKPLRRSLQGHTIETAFERGWSTLENGELLAQAERAGFDAL